VYQDRHLKDKQTSTRCSGCTTEEVLDALLAEHNLNWEKVGNQYIISIQDSKEEMYAIHGYVRDYISGESIPYANVFFMNTSTGGVTNQNGYFSLKAPRGKHTLQVSYIGYKMVRKIVTAMENTISYYLIELHPKVLRGKGVIVTGGNLEFMDQPIKSGRISFSPRHIASLPKLGETDAFRSMQLLPGIHIGNTGSAGLYIRGGTPDQNLILLDGIPIYQTDHYYGFFSAINSDAVKDIQIFKGGFPAKYGGRTSSVIEITGKQGSTKYKRLNVSANLLTAGFTYEQPLFGQGSIFLAYRGSYSHYYKTSLYHHIYDFLTKEGGSENSTAISNPTSTYTPDLSFSDFNGKVTFIPSNKDVISFSYFSGKDKISRMFDFPFNSSIKKIEDGIKWNNIGTSLNWSHIWSGTIYSTALLSRSIYDIHSFSEREYKIGIEDEVILDTLNLTDDNQIEDITIQFNSLYKVNSTHSLEFGFIYKRSFTQFFLELSEDNSPFIPKTGKLSSIYFQDKLNTGKPLEATIGLRLSNYNLTGEHYIEPRASFTYAFTDWFSLKGSVGQYTQFLHRFSNNFTIGGKKFVWIQSNEQLKPVSSQQFDIGFQHENDYWTAGVSAYHRTYNNLLDFSRLLKPIDPYKVLDEGPGEKNNLPISSGNSKGLELFLHKKSGSLHGWLSYTFGKIEHFSPDLNDGKTFLADHDRTHEFKTVAITSPGTWDITLSWIYSSGMTYTPKGRKIKSNESPYVLVYSIIPEDSSANRNTERLDPIQRIDLSITKHLELFSSHWELGFSIFNLFNKKNISHAKFVDSEGNILPTEVHMLGITSTFHIRLSL
jgi:outer membrane receptor for ferrienterochelin and colicin